MGANSFTLPQWLYNIILFRCLHSFPLPPSRPNLNPNSELIAFPEIYTKGLVSALILPYFIQLCWGRGGVLLFRVYSKHSKNVEKIEKYEQDERKRRREGGKHGGKEGGRIRMISRKSGQENSDVIDRRVRGLVSGSVLVIFYLHC